MTETATMVTPEMEQYKGVWINEEDSFPVTESEIRRWAIAVYWPDKPPPLFWDSAYAATTKWGGIVAPEDFSPFAWPIPTGEVVHPSAKLPGFLGRVILNGGQTDTYGLRIRPGDVITSRACLSHWEEKEAKSGRKLFSYYKTEWHNQNGELVRTRLATTIQF